LDAVEHPRSLVHRVDQRQQLGSLPALAGADQVLGLPALDARRGDLLDAQASERRQQVQANAGAAVAERRGTPAALVLAPGQPLLRELLERHAGAHDLHVPATRVGEDRFQRGLRGTAIEVAGRRRAALGPLGPEELVDLAHPAGRGRVRRAVLRVPDDAPLSLDATNVATDGRRPDWIEIAHGA
jgi:hypothetical protein